MVSTRRTETRSERPLVDFVVAKVADIPQGGLRHVVADDREFVVLHKDGQLYAYRNECPHQGAPMSAGIITGAMKPTDVGEDYQYGDEGEYLVCPRHRWKFCIETGQSIYGIDPRRMSPVDVRAEGGDVILSLRRRPAAPSSSALS